MRCFFLISGLVLYAQAVQISVGGLGVLKGSISPFSNLVAVWNRIPYSLPPVGQSRWQPPVPHGPWSSPRDAVEFGSACIGSEAQRSPNVTVSEDCLFLNVASPLRTSQINKNHLVPVLVFIHGGAFAIGVPTHNNLPNCQ